MELVTFNNQQLFFTGCAVYCVMPGGHCGNMPSAVLKDGQWYRYGSGYKKTIMDTPFGQEHKDFLEYLAQRKAA